MKIVTSRQAKAHSRVRAVAFGMLAYAGLGVAEAAWLVADETSHEYLREISARVGDGNVNERLEKLYNAQELGSASKSGDLEKEPDGDGRLDHAAPSSISVGASTRCPKAGASGVAAQQRQICEEIIKTELARYRFSLRMYELADTRYKRLKELEDERKDLKSEADNIGRLQDNSNRLLALISLTQIDQQQHRTYMAAYDARLTHLTAVRDALTRQALQGSRSRGAGIGGEIGRGAIGLAALAAALDVVKSDREYDPVRRQ